MGEVVILDTPTRLDIPPERVLRSALENKNLTGVILLGIEEEKMFFSSSIANVEQILWGLEKMKKMLLENF